MKFGIALRNMGPQSTRSCLLHCAKGAESAGLDHIWTVDHIAIPPEDSEGSDGRYLDPLACLAFLAAATERIGIGVSVLVLPYRPPLPTAKWVATIQELSEGRLLFGAGVGWMEPEFRALGVDRKRRGALTDETLEFLRACFEAPDDLVEARGQRFLFRPRPERPPIFIGGMGDAALRRVVRYGDAWLPIGTDTDKIALGAQRLAELASEAGRETPDVVLLGGLDDDPGAAAESLARCRELGASHFIRGGRYADEADFDRQLEHLAAVRELVGPSVSGSPRG